MIINCIGEKIIPKNISLEEYQESYHKVAKADRARSFYIHLAIYLSINAVSAINLIFTPNFIWVIFPIIFWGIGVVWNYISSFILVDKKLQKLSFKG
ncbi:MAG: 2TM domain-containing protein [Methanobacteriaceae archaeon]|nr:2TM domain-containing protein [Methanobacteriaceae archaeon]MDP2835436.1 2TM domain-containing protein [Methanobacteriaceae archaeon]MDP3033589.1 2TM domain-containing protein [Methanobacteriaceae archaeon]MDP3486246.1 2TM domain-containing protein [Methanobacteriaceae archaeon]